MSFAILKLLMPDYLEKFEKMRVAGNLAARTLDMLTDNIKPRVTTEFIDKLGINNFNFFIYFNFF